MSQSVALLYPKSVLYYTVIQLINFVVNLSLYLVSFDFEWMVLGDGNQNRIMLMQGYQLEKLNKHVS